MTINARILIVSQPAPLTQCLAFRDRACERLTAVDLPGGPQPPRLADTCAPGITAFEVSRARLDGSVAGFNLADCAPGLVGLIDATSLKSGNVHFDLPEPNAIRSISVGRLFLPLTGGARRQPTFGLRATASDSSDVSPSTRALAVAEMPGLLGLTPAQSVEIDGRPALREPADGGYVLSGLRKGVDPKINIPDDDIVVEPSGLMVGGMVSAGEAWQHVDSLGPLSPLRTKFDFSFRSGELDTVEAFAEKIAALVGSSGIWSLKLFAATLTEPAQALLGGDDPGPAGADIPHLPLFATGSTKDGPSHTDWTLRRTSDDHWQIVAHIDVAQAESATSWHTEIAPELFSSPADHRRPPGSW